jgi:hypothetical protein
LTLPHPQPALPLSSPACGRRLVALAGFCSYNRAGQREAARRWGGYLQSLTCLSPQCARRRFARSTQHVGNKLTLTCMCKPPVELSHCLAQLLTCVRCHCTHLLQVDHHLCHP